MINVDCISSNVLPFVSGTIFHTNRIVKAHIPLKMKKVPAELHSSIKLNVYVTTQELAQLVKTTRLPADALTFTGNISAIITQGIPDMPMAKPQPKPNMPTKVNIGVSSFRLWDSWKQNDNPTRNKHKHDVVAETCLVTTLIISFIKIKVNRCPCEF